MSRLDWLSKAALLLGVAGMAFPQELGRWGSGTSSRVSVPAFGAVQGAPRIRFYSRANGVMDSSAIDRDTPLRDGTSPEAVGYGVEVGIGALGYHRWQRSVLGVDYHSTFPRYWPARNQDGGNHLLTLGWMRQITPRLTLALAESGGSFTRRFLYYSPTSFTDAPGAFDPSKELFDNRTHYLSTTATLHYQWTQRLTFDAGAAHSLIRRESAALVGLNSYQGNTGVSYTLSPTRILGVDYYFNHFSYTRISGAADLHNVGVNYTQQIGRNWAASVRVGGYRTEREALQRVELDPSVAGLVGQRTVLQTSGGVNYYPSLDGRLRRRFYHSTLWFGYTGSIDPGNGVYLASRRRAVDAGFTYTGLRRWNIGWNGGYGRYQSLTDNLGQYSSYRAGAGVTYRMARSLHLVTRFDTDKYQLRATGFSRERYRFTFGLAVASGEVPLSLW